MELQFDTNPQTLKAVIGPGISMEAFEVGDEVYQLFSSITSICLLSRAATLSFTPGTTSNNRNGIST